MGYRLEFSKRAMKDAVKLEAAGLKEKAVGLLRMLRENPYQTSPYYEKLAGDLNGAYSRRINRTHRLVYEIDEGRKTVYVMAMWTYYE